jgi:hypothetical protein
LITPDFDLNLSAETTLQTRERLILPSQWLES